MVVNGEGGLAIDEFQALLGELAAQIPSEFFRELNGGILLLEKTRVHPRSSRALILGEYRVEVPGLGRFIVIYYGSFCKYLGKEASPQLIRRKLWETLLHELRHHWESLAGVRDLEREDEGKLQRLLAAGPGSGLPVP